MTKKVAISFLQDRVDLIDRHYPDIKDYREALVMAIKALETKKVGEWCPQNDDYFDWYECSECGYGSDGEMQYSSEYDVRTKYCPNCGAEMESEE